MKAIFIAFDQAHYEKIIEIREKRNCRGLTAWEMVQGRGTKTGEPHYGSHAWPSMASAIMSMVQDERVAEVLTTLRKIDEESPMLGLRAWTWNIEESI